ncbi:MAG: FkbM family methyltransferase [Actinobacteria bacterium]|nr:MAG: FkbM family methyltransferase [Actinomycetota bacterium]
MGAAVTARRRVRRLGQFLGELSWPRDAWPLLRLAWSRAFGGSGEVRLHPRSIGGRGVAVRLGTTDLVTFYECFVRRYHRPSRVIPGVALVADMGANVGYTMIDLLGVYPSARGVAIEMDGANFDVLARNLEALGGRAEAVHAAVWTDCGGVEYDAGSAENAYAAGTATGSQRAVRVASITPGDALRAAHGAPRCLVKMDIEGAEAAVFACQDLGWLDSVAAIMLEIHEDDDVAPITAVLERAGFTVAAVEGSPYGYECVRTAPDGGGRP